MTIWFSSFGVLMALGCFLPAQTQKFERAVEVTFPNHRYQQTHQSIKDVDFKNVTIWLSQTTVRLRDGKYKSPRQNSFHDEVTLEKIFYFAAEPGQREYALLVFDWFSVGGSSSDYGIIQTLRLEDGHLVVTQEFSFDRQAPGNGEQFDPESRRLTITARASDESAHCCPEHLERAVFEWRDNRFRLRRRTVSTLPAGTHR